MATRAASREYFSGYRSMGKAVAGSRSRPGVQAREGGRSEEVYRIIAGDGRNTVGWRLVAQSSTIISGRPRIFRAQPSVEPPPKWGPSLPFLELAEPWWVQRCG